MATFKISDIPLVDSDPAETFTPAPTQADVPSVPVIGIAQSSAPPPAMLDTFGQSPWVDEEKDYNKALNDWYRSGQEAVDNAVFDPDKAFKGMNLDFEADPETAKRTLINESWMELNHDEPLAPTELQRAVQMQVASLAKFNEMVSTPEDLYELIKKDAGKRKDAKDLFYGLGTDSAKAATISAFGEAGQTYQAWRETVKGKPGYDPINEADYFEAWHDAKQQMNESLAPYRAEVTEVWNGWKESLGAGKVVGVASGLIQDAFLGGMGETDAALAKKSTRRTAFDIYDKLTDEEKPKFMEALGVLAANVPKAEKPLFFANIGKQSGRDIESLAQNAGTATVDFMMNPEMWDTSSGSTGKPTEYRRQADFVQRLQNLQEGTYDPVQKVSDSWIGKLGETVAYGTAGVVATSVSAMNPYTATALFASLTENHYQSLLNAQMEAGVSYEKASAYATNHAFVGAAVETASEMVGSRLLRGQLPFFDKALTRAMDKIKNPLLRGGTRFLAGGIESGVQEVGQNYIDPSIRGLSAAFGEDTGTIVMPGAQENIESFVSVLPLALMGIPGAAGRDARVKAFAAATDLQMAAVGYTAESVQAIRTGIALGLDSGAAAIDQQVRTPETPEAIAAQEALKAQLASARQALEQLKNLGYAPPTFSVTPEGIYVFDGEGKELGIAPDWDGAQRIAGAHTSALENLSRERQDVLQTLFTATAAAAKLDPSSITEVDLGDFDPSKATPGGAVNYAQQVAMKEKAAGGTGKIAYSVFGNSVTSFAEGLRTTINRLFDGAAVTDVFHETTHGLRRAGHNAGTLTKGMEISLLMNHDLVSGNRRARDAKGKKTGELLRFIPEGITAEMMETGEIPADMIPAEFNGDGARYAEKLLDEGISEMVEVEVLKLRKGEGKGKLGITRADISLNLRSLAKINSETAGSWTSFFAAVRARWGLTLSRAILFMRAEKNGEFDPAERDAYLDKLLGLDQQTEHDAGVMAEFDAMFGPEKGKVAEDDIPFSIGRATVKTTPETRTFQGAEGSPSVIGPASFTIGAFHGTPHKVDKFSTEKIGTGEGAQAYGWGLYFAEDESVARFYRDSLSVAQDEFGEHVRQLIDEKLKSSAGSFEHAKKDVLADLENRIRKLKSDTTEGYFSEEDYLRSLDDPAFAEEYQAAQIESLELELKAVENFQKPNLYTVNLDVNDEDLLDLDKPLSGQNQAIRDILLPIIEAQQAKFPTLIPAGFDIERLAGGGLLNVMGRDESDSLGTDKDASMRLLAAGIPGIRYLDGNSRGAGDGSHNYVIFDESKIQITEENGTPVEIGGEASFSIGRAVQIAKQLDKTAKIAEEDFFKTFWPRMMKLSGQNLKASTRNINEAAKRAVADIGDWVKINPKFQNYYNEDWKNTRDILDDSFDDFTDDLFKGFRLFTGLTSPSTPLDGNMSDAVQLMNLWIGKGSLLSLTLKKSDKGNRAAGPGPFPLRSNTGATKIFSLHAVEKLFRKFGDWEKTVQFLNEPVSVKELHAFNKEMGYAGSVGGIGNIRRVVKEATGQDELIPRMFIFGQKVGAYTLNTVGDSRYTTTDIWESRYIRSYFPEMFKTSDGLPVNEEEHTIFQRFASAFNAQFEAQYGVKLENSALQAVRWFYMLAHAKEAGYRYARTNETISGYTHKAVRNYLGNDPQNRGRGGEGSGGAEQEVASFSIGRVPSFLQLLDNTAKDAEGLVDEHHRNPASILASIGSKSDGKGGLRTDVEKRRKSGRILVTGERLAEWAKENGRVLNPSAILGIPDLEAVAGNEHRILFDEPTGQVIKLTKPGMFGAQADDAGEYLERWALHNKVFGGEVAFEGVVVLPGEDQPRAVISQEFIKGRDSTKEELAEYLKGKGFYEREGWFWIHPILGVTVWDTLTPGNAITTEAGDVRVIDLQIGMASPVELAKVRSETGIGRETSFSIGGVKAGGFEKAKAEGRTFTGKDGKERFELDASKAAFNPSGIEDPAHRNGFKRLGDDSPIGWLVPEGKDTPLGNLMAFDELYDNYPQMAGLNVRLKTLPAGTHGRFARVEINEKASLEFSNIDLSDKLKTGTALSVLLHEVQHVIQDIEGFSQGGSPEQFQEYDEAGLKLENNKYVAAMRALIDEHEAKGGTAKDAMQSDYGKVLGDSLIKIQDALREPARKYRALPGEKEARGVQARQSMTAEERATTPFMDQYPSFSIGPAKVAGILSDNALARITDPRRRTYVMSKISRDFNAMRLQIERISSLAGIRRSKGDLSREAMAREDLAAEEKIAAIHARFGSLLADEDLVKIKSQPVHAHLADPDTPLRGRLKSKAAAIKSNPERYQLHRAGDYDGSDGVSRSVFGGQNMPDQAAQELFDEGLIKEPTADAMWEALLAEQNTVAGMKEMLLKAKEQIRQAKQEAKQEANEWLATQSKDQEVNFSDKEEIRRALRMLDAILLALPAEIRGKIGGYTQISMITTDEARLAYLQDKLAKADKELETFLRVEYAKEWEELLKKAAPKTNEAGQRPTGSIAADAYDVFKLAEWAMGQSFALGEAEADKWDAIADNPETEIPEADLARVKAQMIRLTTNWNAADAARREQAVLEGDKIYFGGLRALAIDNSRRRERLGKLRTSAIKGTGKTGARMEREAAKQAAASKGGVFREMSWEFLSFGQLVNVLFGEKSDVAKWFNAREISASNAAHDGFQAKANSLESLFDTLSGNRFDGEKLRHRMATAQTIKVTDALGVQQSLSDAQAITFLLMWRQEDGRRHMEGIIDEQTGAVISTWGWDEDSAADIEKQLSREGRAVMSFLASSYGEEYDRINEVFRKIWNVSMPRHKMYAPLSVNPVQGKGDTIMDPVSGDTMGAGMTPGSLKNRSFSAIAEPELKDAFQVFLTHARQMEHFIAYGEFSRDALGVINRRETRSAILAAGGPTAAGTLSKWIDYFALGGLQDANMGSKWGRVMGGMLGRISQAALVGRVSVLAMQSLQLAAASFKMPLGSFLTRFAKLSTGQLGWNDAINSDYIQRRVSQMPPLVRDMLAGIASGTPNRAKYLAGILGQTISGADALFTAGTYAIFYDYHLKIAKAAKAENPEAVAHKEAERLTDQVAQPTRTGARSWLEVANQGNPAFRAMWNFSSDPRQKASLIVYEAMRRDTSGLDKAGNVAFMTAKVWIIGGILTTLLRTIIRDLRSDDDDEIFDERYWNPSRLALMAFTGPLSAVPYLGGMVEASTYAATGQFMPKGGMLNYMESAASMPAKWDKGKVEPLKDMETLATAGAGLSGTSAAAASVMHIIRDLVGFIENLEGPD